MEAERLLDGLNDAQRQAVASDVVPLCIVAGAGSGKTRVLTRRIAYRAVTGAHDPRHVLALTFTRKAAGEMQQRLRSLGLRDRVVAGTFHAVAYAQLKARWADRGVDPPQLLERKAEIVARALPGRGPRRDAMLLDAIGEIEWAKARRVMPDAYVEAAEHAKRRPSLELTQVAAVFERYEEEKRRRRVIDFDDMLSLCRRELTRDETFAAAQRWRFQHLFVDEYQDVNPLQQALLDAWRGNRPDLCVVGDPNQAIYSWNGADARYLTEFDRRFPGCEVVRLSDNYRSSPQILTVANAVLGGSTSAREAARNGTRADGVRLGALRANRPDAAIPGVHHHPTAAAEAAATARRIRDGHGPGSSWNAQAILVRTNAQTVLLEEALKAAGIPFRIRGGTGLLDQPEVKAALRELRRGARSYDQAMVDLRAMIDEQRAATRTPGAQGPADTEEVDAGDDAHVANLEELLRLTGDYAAVDGAPTVAGFASWLFQTARSDQPDAAGDAVDVLTFHAAKGLEWPVVHLVGLEQGLVPISHARTPAAMAEERRLFYVAVTRAERELHCSWAEQRDYGGRSMDRSPSPYLTQVDAAVAALSRGSVPEDWAAHFAGLDVAHPVVDAPPRPRRRDRSTAPVAPQDAPLVEALKAWRLKVARGADVPAYVVFPDATLHAIAASRPASVTALLDLPGIGPVKADRYGPDVLAVVAEHVPG